LKKFREAIQRIQKFNISTKANQKARADSSQPQSLDPVDCVMAIDERELQSLGRSNKSQKLGEIMFH
jgi:hypothetical protein